MPIYSYTCKQVVKADNTNDPYTGGRDFICSHNYEVLYQNHAAVEREEPTEICPKCGGVDKQRDEVTTGTSHILKGKGWARDNYS